MTGVEETKATEYLRPDSKLDYTNYPIYPFPAWPFVLDELLGEKIILEAGG